MIDLFANPSSVILRVSWRREDANDATTSSRKWTKQLSPNVRSRSSLEQAPTELCRVFDCIADMLVWVFDHFRSLGPTA
jgi:hypothetical protein